MKLEFFTGAATLLLGLALDSFGACVIGTFFVLLVAADAVPRWMRHEVETWRRVVRHEDINQLGLRRIDDRHTNRGSHVA